MPYPEYIPTRVVSIGGAAVLESGSLLKIQVAIVSSRSLVWDATGYRFERGGVAVQSELGSEVQLILPRTDVPGWKDAATGAVLDVSAPDAYSHRYTATVRFADSNDRTAVGAGSYEIGPFVVPEGDGAIDLDKLVPASTVAGDSISIPDLWGQLVADAQAAATDAQAALVDSDAFIASQITTPGTETEEALNAAIGAVGKKTFTGKTTATPGRSGEQLVPQFVDNPVDLITLAQIGMPSIATMRVFCTDGIITSPLGRFYAYLSTDHDVAGTPEPFNGKGGVALAYANSPLGPWTVYKPGGTLALYQDTVVGNQTETPTPLYVPDDPAGKPIYIYYQNQGAGLNQSTILARSATGLPASFERVGIVIQGRGTTTPVWPGDGQSTYFEPCWINGRVVGVQLIGGGNWAQYGRSYSSDGINFVTDPRRFGHFSHLIGSDNARRVSVRSIFTWRGVPWAQVTIGSHTSGFVTAPRQVGFAQLSSDLRRIVGKVHTLADAAIGAGQVFEHDGKLYLFYRSGDAYSAFRVAVAEA